MRVLLIDVDSRLPNLALMKYSTYYKDRNHEVGFNVNDPDKIIGSVIFSKHKHIPNAWHTLYPGVDISVGGPGYDPKMKMPEEVERCKPDHSLYPNSKYSIGRVTSGCLRDCYFCVVPKMEGGKIRYIQSPKDIWKEGTILRLLDDNILFMPKAFWEVHDFCISNNVKIHFEYLDIRLITKEYAQGLKEMKHDGQIKFSYDTTNDEPSIRNGIETMIKNGHRPGNIQFLIYCHDEPSIPDAMYRWDVIRSYGCEPFLMVNNEKRTKRLRRIARRGDRPAIWRNLKTEEVFA